MTPLAQESFAMSKVISPANFAPRGASAFSMGASSPKAARVAACPAWPTVALAPSCLSRARTSVIPAFEFKMIFRADLGMSNSGKAESRSTGAFRAGCRCSGTCATAAVPRSPNTWVTSDGGRSVTSAMSPQSSSNVVPLTIWASTCANSACSRNSLTAGSKLEESRAQPIDALGITDRGSKHGFQGLHHGIIPSAVADDDQPESLQ